MPAHSDPAMDAPVARMTAAELDAARRDVGGRKLAIRQAYPLGRLPYERLRPYNDRLDQINAADMELQRYRKAV